MNEFANRKDWLLWRKAGIGASDVPAILGVSPYKTILDIYNDKISDLIEEKTSYIMELGNTLEPIARARYELLSGYDYPAANFVHVLSPHYRASLDGYNKELNRAIEVKYVGKTFTDKCPDKYYPQIQYQYAVTLASEIDLVQVDNMNRINVIPVARDDEYIREMLVKVDQFWDCVLKRDMETIKSLIPIKVKKPRAKKIKEKLCETN